ncbi:MAG: hypothetical protein A3K46_03045 [Chloroflexi bacterium RBG_13_60_9]|nr:MAG: hypothetical protein A3K46_03045 [Chloroflexi bacterium RBG_13_60_9]
MRSSNPTSRSTSCARSRRPLFTPAYRSGNSTFAVAVERPSRLKLWNTKPTFRLRISASASSCNSETVFPSSR